MRNHRIAAESRRLEFLIDHPIADHVLDRVGHHGDRVANQVGAVAGRVERREGPVRLPRRFGGAERRVLSPQRLERAKPHAEFPEQFFGVGESVE